MLFQEQPTDPWTQLDFQLIEAMQILEDETCQLCGNPIWVCRNQEASNVGFKVRVATCFGKAELDKWEENDSKREGKKRYGQYPYIVAYTYDESDMPSRQRYYQSLMNNHDVK